MNRLTDSDRAAIVRALCEGNSIRAAARVTGAAKATVLKLLVELGEFCSIYQDWALRNLATKRVEADEIWVFVGANGKNATKHRQADIWTYTALDADSKLMLSWLVGPRNGVSTLRFMADVAERLGNRLQLSTDGPSWHVAVVENALEWNDVGLAQAIKTYGIPMDETERQQRYSPAVCTGAIKTPIMGNPNMNQASTFFVARPNLSIRMGMRRFTRVTNGFSKKVENHAHAVSLFFMYYNYCKAHTTLTIAAKGVKTTPAMATSLTDHAWTVEEILAKMSPDYRLH